MENISKYITYKEATRSQTAIKLGIPNDPTTEHLDNMIIVAKDIFDPMREHFGKPIYISNFYRCKKLNDKIPGASKTSDHQYGNAIDIDDTFNNGITNKMMFDWIRANCEFDQLIWEHGTDKNPDWVHFSKRKTGNRKQVLRAYKVKVGNEYKTKYKPI